MVKLITLKVIDIRNRNHEHDHFMVMHMINTIEWKIGQPLSTKEVNLILKRKNTRLIVEHS